MKTTDNSTIAAAVVYIAIGIGCVVTTIFSSVDAPAYQVAFAVIAGGVTAGYGFDKLRAPKK